MNYEEKYNNLVVAIKQLQEANPSDEGIQNWVNDNVPELQESEGEKIKKYILNFINLNKGVNLSPDDADKMIAWLEKQGKQKENATRYKIAKYLKNLILDQSQRGFPMLNYEGRIEEEVDFIINIAKKELKQGEQKPAHKEYTFTAIPRLLEMIQPTDRAKSYCQKLIDSLEQEGYSTDANIVRERLLWMTATMDEQKPAWSEEDERILLRLIAHFDWHGDTRFTKEDCQEVTNWLKSLRPQSWIKYGKEAE